MLVPRGTNFGFHLLSINFAVGVKRIGGSESFRNKMPAGGLSIANYKNKYIIRYLIWNLKNLN